MGLTDSKFRLPSFTAIKNLRTLQELPLCTLGQIQEAFTFLQESPYVQQLSINQQAFEDIFGVLFQDPSIHFTTFQRPGVPVGVTMEIFVLIILFCDASLPQKLRLLCDIHVELRQHIRMDALQLVVYRVLYCMPLLFHLDIPNRDTIYNFVEESIQQYKDRSQLAATIAPTTTNNPHSHATTTTEEIATTSSATHSNNSNSNNSTNSFDFTDLWQWCQDVNQISSYLDSIQKICQTVNTKVDRSHKGRSWMARNSFFSTASGGNMRASLMGDLMNALKAWNNDFTTDFLVQKITENRPALWKYTVYDLSLQNSDAWLNDVPTHVSHESRVFCSLEHLILSKTDCLPVFKPMHHHHHGQHVHHQQSSNPHANSISISSSSQRDKDKENKSSNHNKQISTLYSVLDHMTILSCILESCPAHVFHALEHDIQKKRSRRLSFDFDNNQSIEEGELDDGGDEQLPSSPLVIEVEDDNFASTFDEDNNNNNNDESAIRLPSALKRRNRSQKNNFDDTSRPWQTLGETLSQTHIDGLFNSLATFITSQHGNKGSSRGGDGFSAIPHRDSMTSLQFRSPTSSNAANSNNKPYHVKQALDYRINHCMTFLPAHNQQHHSSLQTHNSQGPLQLQAFNMDHQMFNIISSIAQGYRYIPITTIDNPSNVLHIVNIAEVATFLLEHYQEFFPADMAKQTLFQTNLIRKPVAVSRAMNLGSAWLVMLTSALDSCLIVDEQEKVCGVLTAKHIESLWWNYKQQHQMLSTFDDVVKDYHHAAYHPYDPYAHNSTSNALSGHNPNMHLMNANVMIVNNLNSVHNFSSFSVMMQTLSQCDRLDVHTFPFEQFTSCDDETAQRQIKLWQCRLLRYSTLEAIQKGLATDDTTSLATTTTAATGAKGSVAGTAASNTPFFSPLTTATTNANNGGELSTKNNSPNRTDKGNGRNFDFKNIDGIKEESSKASPAGKQQQLSTKSQPSPARPRDPPPSIGMLSRGNTQFLSPGGNAAGVSSQPTTANGMRPLLNSSGAAMGSRGQKVNAVRQKERMREQSRLRAAASRRLERWFAALKLVTPMDNIRSVLHVMSTQQTSCVHVVSTEGEPVGVISIHDICRYLISHEQKTRAQFAEQQTRQENIAAALQKVKGAL